MNRRRSVFTLSVGSVVESLLGLVERRLLVVAVENSSLSRHRVVDRDLNRARNLSISGFNFDARLSSTYGFKTS